MSSSPKWKHPGAVNRFTGTVSSKVFQGDFADFQIRVGGVTLLARTHPSLRTPTGEAIHLSIAPEKCIVLAPSALPGGP